MAEGRAGQGDEEAGPRIGRRGFIGAGLAGAGAALIAPPSGAAAQSAQTVADPQPGKPKQHQKHLHKTAPKGSAGQIPHLPIKAFFPNLPAIPADLAGMAETLVRLGLRSEQVIQAKQGLTRLFTIDGRTETGYAFLYGDTNAAAKTTAWTELEKNLRTDPEQVVTERIVKPIREKKGPRPLQLAGTPDALSLEQPEQFSISWTSFPTSTTTDFPRCRPGHRP